MSGSTNKHSPWAFRNLRMSPIPRLSLRGSPLDASMALPDPVTGTNKKLSDPPCAASRRKCSLLPQRRSACYHHPPWNFSGFLKFNIVRCHKQNSSILLFLSKLCRFKQIPLYLYISRLKSWTSFLGVQPVQSHSTLCFKVSWACFNALLWQA